MEFVRSRNSTYNDSREESILILLHVECNMFERNTFLGIAILNRSCSCYAIAAIMLEDDSKRLLISFYC